MFASLTATKVGKFIAAGQSSSSLLILSSSPRHRTGLPGDLGAESISPEDINTFIRQTTEDIQSLSYNYERMEASGGGPGYGAGPSRSNAGQFRGAGGDKSRPGAGERDAHSTDSGIQNSNPDLRGDVMDAGKGGDFMPLGGRRYNPTCYDGQVGIDEICCPDSVLEIACLCFHLEQCMNFSFFSSDEMGYVCFPTRQESVHACTYPFLFR